MGETSNKLNKSNGSKSRTSKTPAAFSVRLKRSELFFSVIQVPLDFFMIVLAALTAWEIRNLPQDITGLNRLYNVTFEDYIAIIFVVVPFFIFVYAIEGLYNIRSTRRYWQEVYSVFRATSIALIIIIVGVFLEREWFSSRFIILAGWGIAVVYVSFGRYLVRSLQKWLLVTREMGVHRVLLINGGGRKTRQIREIFESNKALGYKVIDTIQDINLRTIKQVRQEKGVDEIILCDPSAPDDQQEKLIDYCAINNISYSYVPTTVQTPRYRLRMLGGEPLFEVLHTPLDGWGKVAKRLFDIVGSIVLILLSSPIMLVVAIAIRLDSNGPIIYKNLRVGANGKTFYLYKFRYMKWELSTDKANPKWREALEFEKQLIAERSVRKGPLYKIKDDPRKTKVGRFIEKYSIDELPQFFNVLKGDMSLVGPRPHQAREVEKYREYHRRLLTIKPGVTGLAQVSGRSDLDFEDEYRYDVLYIESWSLWQDTSICFKTVGVLLKKRKN